MLTRKGVYPYSYMDSFDKFDEVELPERAAFTNDLTKKKISDDDWRFVNDLMITFDLKTLGELHDLYMEIVSYKYTTDAPTSYGNLITSVHTSSPVHTIISSTIHPTFYN